MENHIFLLLRDVSNKPLQGMAPTECLLSAFVLDCFLACLLAHLLCLPSRLLLACLLACLLPYLLACSLVCSLACLLAYLLACWRACWPGCLPACLPACLHACLLACIHARDLQNSFSMFSWGMLIKAFGTKLPHSNLYSGLTLLNLWPLGLGLCLVKTASKLNLKIRNYPDIIGELLARERTMVGNRTSGH